MINKFLLCLFILVLCVQMRAQKTTVFRKKTYLVYPQKLGSSANTYIYIDFNPLEKELEASNLQFNNVYFPPMLDSMPDGEYLIYYEPRTYRNRALFGKRKNTFVTDSNTVYGSFTIRNGKKNGPAIVYDKYKQNRIVAYLNYADDMLEGRNVFMENNDKRSVYELMYKKGILDGIQREYGLFGGDSVNTVLVGVKNGKLDGPFKSINYYYWKKRFRPYSYWSGQYDEDKKCGKWMFSYDGKLTNNEYFYSDGKITRRNHYNWRTGHLESFTCYGKDSMAKYIGDYQNDSLMPVAENDIQIRHEYKSYDDKHVVRNNMVKLERNNKTGLFYTDYFIVDFYASKSYYKRFHTNTDYDYTIYSARDSIINGYTIRYYTSPFLKKELSEDMYVILPSWDLGFFRSVILSSGIVDARGQKYTMTDYPEKLLYIPKDSLKPLLLETVTWRHVTTASYFYKPLDYRYENTSDKRSKHTITYQVSGVDSTGTILRFTSFVADDDSLLIVDTVMLKGVYLEQRDVFLEESLNKYIERYGSPALTLKPVQHTAIYRNGQPYTGLLIIDNLYKRNKTGFKLRFKQGKGGGPDRLFLGIFLKKDDLRVSEYGVFLMPVFRRNYEVSKGLLDGKVHYFDIHKDYMFTVEYEKNRLNSRIDYNPYKLNANAHYAALHNASRQYPWGNQNKKLKSSKKSLSRSGHNSIKFVNGKKEGLWHIETRTAKFDLIFHNDLQDGLQREHYEKEWRSMDEYYTNIYKMSHDSLLGEAINLAGTGYPGITGHFNAGLPHGHFTQYFGSDTQRIWRSCYFNHGKLAGNYYEYRDSGGLRMKIQFKGNNYNKFQRHMQSGQRFDSEYGGEFPQSYESSDLPNMKVDHYFKIIFNYTGLMHGNYTYYYKNGEVFSQGYKKENELGAWQDGYYLNPKPDGKWVFFREGHRLYKHIWFKDSLLTSPKGDSIPVHGLVKAYYDDGKLMFTGYATDLDLAYSCESESDMPVEDDYYLEFFDTLGKQVLVNGSGFVKELQANGYLLKEGRVENHLKQGVWIYYSKFGLPEQMGVYKDGKKTGRWLSGDLGGLNLDDKICYMSDEEFQTWIRISGGDLQLEEIFYIDGKRISNTSINAKK